MHPLISQHAADPPKPHSQQPIPTPTPIETVTPVEPETYRTRTAHAKLTELEEKEKITSQKVGNDKLWQLSKSEKQ